MLKLSASLFRFRLLGIQKRYWEQLLLLIDRYISKSADYRKMINADIDFKKIVSSKIAF